MPRGLGGCLVWGLVALVLVVALCVAPLTAWRLSRQGDETASAGPTPTPTSDIPALGAFPPGYTPVPTTPGGSAAAPVPIPTAGPGGTSPNGNPVTPGWGLWTPTPPPPAAPAPTTVAAPPSSAAVPPPAGGVWYPWPSNIPWYGPWLVNGKYVWWPGGGHPPPPGGHPCKGCGWPVPSPTLPPGALPVGVQPGYRCADGFYIPRGQGNWQWLLGRYQVDGETITDRLGGPANRPTVHTGCKPVP